MKTMRFSTLIKLCGLPLLVEIPHRLNKSGREAMMHAILNKKILTLHHGETDRQRMWAEPGQHAVNVIGFILFPKPIPEHVEYVIGVEGRMAEMKMLNELCGLTRKSRL